jgi:hypothetical protein
MRTLSSTRDSSLSRFAGARDGHKVGADAAGFDGFVGDAFVGEAEVAGGLLKRGVENGVLDGDGRLAWFGYGLVMSVVTNYRDSGWGEGGVCSGVGVWCGYLTVQVG